MGEVEVNRFERPLHPCACQNDNGVGWLKRIFTRQESADPEEDRYRRCDGEYR